MAFKVGLNRKEQILNAKWLAEGVPPQLIAKKLKVSEEVVAKFTQEALDKAKAKAKSREQAYRKAKIKNQQDAEVLKAALTQTAQEPEFS